MEDRRTLHYHRNTVIVPKLGNSSMRKMVRKRRDVVVDNNKRPQNTELKICSTMECNRCRATQNTWRATCYRCGACFYCGLVGGSAYQCQICGNHIPKEDRATPIDRVIKIV
jgi:hypothetical protein